MYISKLAREIEKSKIRVMFDLARGREGVLNFTVGEPDFTTPKSIIDEANKYLSMGYTKYTPNAGIPELQEAIAEHFSSSLYPINPLKEVMITTGATEALFVAMQILMDPNDEIIIPAPHFSSYLAQVKLARCTPRFVPCYKENGFIPRPADIEAAITDKTRLILLNSPCNPTGAEIDAATLQEIADIAIQHDLVVLSDEVYKTIRYSDTPYTSIATLPGMRERTLVIDGFSKAYAMTGWRLGFAIGPEWIISQMPKAHDVIVACVNAPYQFAGAYALRNCGAEVLEMRDKFKARRDFIYNGISGIGRLACLEPQGAFYLFIDVSGTGLDGDEFAKRLLLEHDVAIVPGSGFGPYGENFVRMTFASNEDMLGRGVDAIEKFVRTLD